MDYDVTCRLNLEDDDNDCPRCNGAGTVRDPWLGGEHDCDFCAGTGHVTTKMLQEQDS